MKIVVTRPLPGAHEERLAAAYDEVTVLPAGSPPSVDTLRRAFARVDAAIVQLTNPIDDKTLADANGLRCLFTYSVGVDHVDLPCLRRRGIRLSHTPAILTDATADLAWALLLACARRVVPAARFVEEGRFTGFDPELFLGMPVSGGTLGIVGMGRIGKAMAERARGFRMNVLYASPRALPADEEERLGARHVPLEELLSASDVVSIHCPLTEKTRGLIGRDALARMKPRAVLVNTARGPIVDEAALVEALRARPELCAGLDVFEREPLLAPGLATLPNALCVPHIGSGDFPTREKMAELCVDEALRFARGEPLRYELGT